jgi:hypothetical protein
MQRYAFRRLYVNSKFTLKYIVKEEKTIKQSAVCEELLINDEKN